MNLLEKSIWYIATTINIFALSWFMLGSTANFNRMFDIVSTVVLMFLWIPSLLLVIISIWLIRKGWTPPTNSASLIGVILLLLFSFMLIQNTNTKGWLTDVIYSDDLRITSDEKYQYKIELVNLFQSNKTARLYIKDVNTGENINIDIDIYKSEVHGIGHSSTGTVWGILIPTQNPNIYTLEISKDMEEFYEKFEVDISSKTAQMIIGT